MSEWRASCAPALLHQPYVKTYCILTCVRERAVHDGQGQRARGRHPLALILNPTTRTLQLFSPAYVSARSTTDRASGRGGAIR